MIRSARRWPGQSEARRARCGAETANSSLTVTKCWVTGPRATPRGSSRRTPERSALTPPAPSASRAASRQKGSVCSCCEAKPPFRLPRTTRARIPQRCSQVSAIRRTVLAEKPLNRNRLLTRHVSGMDGLKSRLRFLETEVLSPFRYTSAKGFRAQQLFPRSSLRSVQGSCTLGHRSTPKTRTMQPSPLQPTRLCRRRLVRDLLHFDSFQV